MTAIAPLERRIADQMDPPITERRSHHFGETEPQNTANCFKFALPAQTTSLGPLGDDDPMLVQFDEEVGLPVVSTADHFGEMYEAYGEPDYRKVRDGRTTLPIKFTEERKDEFPKVNFTRDDVLGFFSPESKIANDFPRLYVGPLGDYKQVSQDCIQIIWGDTYARPRFTPGRQERVREVCIVLPDGEILPTLRPATEGWAPVGELF